MRQDRVRDACRGAASVRFTALGEEIENVPSFRYLGRPLSSTDNDWTAILSNLAKARKRWARVSVVLRRTCLGPRVAAMFYKAIVQSVLLFGVETWTLSESMLKCLTGFHHRIARQLSGKTAQRLPHGAWQHHPAADALTACGMFSMDEYIARRRKFWIGIFPNALFSTSVRVPHIFPAPPLAKSFGGTVYKSWTTIM